MTTEKAWLNEPNRLEFKHLGYDCLINRNPYGALCGYVAVPPGHPWHSKTYNDLGEADIWPNVHGGLTYSEKCQGPICHKPKPGEEDDVWWLGFDCAHFDDLIPEYFKEPYLSMDLDLLRGRIYRDIEYVKKEVKKLAKQIKAAA